MKKIDEKRMAALKAIDQSRSRTTIPCSKIFKNKKHEAVIAASREKNSLLLVKTDVVI